MKDYPRLIEHAFPLRQASIDSVHEKNVRHGHISTLHIWPARRPLAAARAALLATLLPDPGTPEGRKDLCEIIGGRLVTETDKEGRVKEITEGGVLRWKQEIDNEGILKSLVEKIRNANDGRSPRVLDPFSGGGAIPLEAMRLGCEVTAADLNPVAWFILKCTLEYPQALAGKNIPLPEFVQTDRQFMEEFLAKAKGISGARLKTAMNALGHVPTEGEQLQNEIDFDGALAKIGVTLEADLAWHVRAWGHWILAQARKELANIYPAYADWQPLLLGQPYDPKPMRIVEPDSQGNISANVLNNDLPQSYLSIKSNPRWIVKPTVAYIWARTVTCKNCRALIPLLKTRWLCKKTNKRIRVVMHTRPDGTGVDFSIEKNVPERGGNVSQRREHDKKMGAGPMSRAGAQCPCCPTIMGMEDLRYEGKNGRIGKVLTAVVMEGPNGKEYRLPTDHEVSVADISDETITRVFSAIPFGLPEEPLPTKDTLGFRVPLYGFDKWRKLFSDRQLIAIGTFVKASAEARIEVDKGCYDSIWKEALAAYSACVVSRTLDYLANLCVWENGAEEIKHLFMRWALPITWDYAEANPLSPVERFFIGGLNSSGRVLDRLHQSDWQGRSIAPHILKKSALEDQEASFDLIVTDPPYYDAIPYSDLMDFFYIWLRRMLHGVTPQFSEAFSDPLSPKWNNASQDGELIDDSSRHGGDKAKSKLAYEDGMARAFQACHASLVENGRFVIVFAHKHPDAWETLVSAIIRSGFVVDGSWPIATEMSGGLRNLGRASLASSIWLVCRKRDPLAKVGWDNRVMTEMRQNISAQLREFWDAGIRGPDFVWAATGPAMEAYSKHPAVRKANSATGEFLTVKEFLDSVRRIVIEFVVGRVLHIESGTDRLDPVTSYYLLHRNDFGFDKAPAGACILYAVSCGISDAELERTWNLVKVKGSKKPEEEDTDEDQANNELEAPEEIGGGEFILRTWKERNEKRMGFESVGGREVPLIDRVHRLMHLWRSGEVRKVDEYLDEYALRRHELFARLIQSLIELSDQGGDERSLLESLSNHLGAKSALANVNLPLGLEDES